MILLTIQRVASIELLYVPPIPEQNEVFHGLSPSPESGDSQQHWQEITGVSFMRTLAFGPPEYDITEDSPMQIAGAMEGQWYVPLQRTRWPRRSTRAGKFEFSCHPSDGTCERLTHAAREEVEDEVKDSPSRSTGSRSSRKRSRHHRHRREDGDNS